MITDPVRQRTLRGALPTHATPRSTARARNTADHQADLAWRLTPRDHWILAMLHEHRVLTAPQITDTAFPSYRSGRQRLRELYQWSVVDRFQPFISVGTAPMHYVLGPAGAAVLAAAYGLEPRALGYRHDRAFGIAHNLRLAHAVGVNEWFAALIATAGTTGDVLDVWWSEQRCARHFGDLVRPDAYGRWSAHDRRVEFFLEFDLGTEALTRVAAKLAGYAALAAATGIVTPLLIWMPTTRREAGARVALHRAWRDLDRPNAVPVATAAAGLLDQTATHPSPADLVWLPLGQDATGPRPVAGPRLPLHGLPLAWPHLPDLADASNVDTAPHVAAGRSVPGPSGTTESGTGPTRLPAPFPMPPTPSLVTRGTAARARNADR